MSLDKALAFTLRWEGGYVNDKDDPGGATNKGITQATYNDWLDSQHLPRRPVKEILDYEVRRIYEDRYWNAASCFKLAEPMDMIHFDSAVNHGLVRAFRFLEASNGDARAYCASREMFYRRLAEAKPRMAKFLNGWLNRLNSLRKTAGLTL